MDNRLELWTVEEFAEFLKVPKNWIYQRSRFGELPGMIRLSPRHIRFDSETVKEWIAQGCPPVEGGESEREIGGLHQKDSPAPYLSARDRA